MGFNLVHFIAVVICISNPIQCCPIRAANKTVTSSQVVIKTNLLFDEIVQEIFVNE